MMPHALKIGSLIVIPPNPWVRVVLAIADHEGVPSIWYQDLAGSKAKNGPTPISDVRLAQRRPIRLRF